MADSTLRLVDPTGRDLAPLPQKRVGYAPRNVMLPGQAVDTAEAGAQRALELMRSPLEQMREAVQTFQGFRGDPLDQALTVRHALKLGVVDAQGLFQGGGTGTGGVGGVGPPGPPGPPGSYVPDLTPPPTLTGLTAQAAFAKIILTWDAATYTVGHGPMQVNIYGVKKARTDPTQPTYADSELVASAADALTIIAIDSDLGVRWHFWAKYETRDEVESLDPAGGLHGVIAQTGLIGGSDLADLIVEAHNLADGAVTGDKLAALAIDATKFANGIQPVGIVTALPVALGYSGPKTVLLVTDGKLYRFVGGAWTKAVDGGDIVANSIVAGSIAAGAINAAQIAAGAITTDKLLVTGRGAALNSDPNTQDISAWTFPSGPNTFHISTITDGRSGPTALVLDNPNVTAYSLPFPTAAGKQYRLRLFARRVGASSTGTVYLRLYFFDATDTFLGTGYVLTAIFPLTGTFESITVPADVWTQYSGTGIVPANAATCRIAIIANYGGTGTVQFQDVRCEEYIGADLIVDGAITATKIAVNAIAVGSAAIQNGAIVNAMIGNAAIDDAKIANLSAAKLTAGDGVIGGTLKSANYVAGSTGWAVFPNGAAEFGFANIRGTLLASQVSAGLVTAGMINANNLIIRDVYGNPLFGSGAPNVAASFAGQGPFATLTQINGSNISTYIAAASIGAAYIGVLSSSNLTVAAISNTINGGTTAGRITIAQNQIKVIDDGGGTRLKIGDLSF